MIFETEQHPRQSCAPVLWITGLAGVGKTTLAQALVRILRAQGLHPLLLDGDALRAALEPTEQHDDHRTEMRLQRAWRLARLARLAASQGIPVIVATISLFQVVQAWNRSATPAYAEVLLRADEASMRLQRPALYGTDQRRAACHVVGMDIAAEFPLRPELSLMQSYTAAGLDLHLNAVLALWRSLMLTRSEIPA